MAYSSTSWPTTVTALSLSTIVPLNAKSVMGFAGAAATTTAGTYSLYLYSSSNKINYNNITGYSPVGGSIGGNFALDLATPQTIYINGQIGSGTTFEIFIGGYEF